MKEETIKTSELSQPVSVQLQSVADELIQTLSLIKQEEINQVPFEGSWTAGQVCEHVNLSVSGIIDTLKAPAEVTERNPDQHANELRDMFLNFDLKFPAAPSLIPLNAPYEKNALVNILTGTFERLTGIVQTEDLTGTFAGFNFPGMGPLTRLEWVYLTVYHTQRHIHQIKNIMKYV